MSKLFPALMGWKGYAVVAAVSMLIGAAGTWRVMSWAEDAAKTHVVQAELKQADKVQHQTEQAAAVTVGASQHIAKAIDHNALVTESLKQKVHEYATPENDANCPVPAGVVRLLNAAADGVPEVPAAAGGHDAEGDPAAASDTVAPSVEDDYVLDLLRDDHDKTDRLNEWHDWYNREAPIFNAALPPPPTD